MRTENLSSNTWYHVAGIWDASTKALELYLNGTICTEIGNRNYPYGAHEALDLGHATASSKFWWGYMDDLHFYDRAFSRDQIYQIYMCTKDGNSDKRVLVSEETSLGDIWQCIVTPNDGSQDGPPTTTNTLQIIGYGGGE